MDGEYSAIIPESKKTNCWRDGVRVASKSTFEMIISHAKLSGYNPTVSNDHDELQPLLKQIGKRRFGIHAH